MAGRKSKITSEVIKRICEIISVGNYANIACQSVNISEQTYYTWLQRGRAEKERIEKLEAQGLDILPSKEGIYLEFLDAVKKAESDAEVMAVMHIRTAMPNQWQAAAWYLERKFPDRYGRREKNINYNIDATDKIDLSSLSDEELATLEALTEKAEIDGEITKH